MRQSFFIGVLIGITLLSGCSPSLFSVNSSRASDPNSALSPTGTDSLRRFVSRSEQILPSLNLIWLGNTDWNLPGDVSEKSHRLSVVNNTRRLRGEIYTVKHSPGDLSRLERLLETELQGWKIRLGREDWFSKEKISWDGVDGILFELGGESEESPLQVCGWGGWDGAFYTFITVVHEGEGERVELRENWEQLTRMISRKEKFTLPQTETDFSSPATHFQSERLGFSMQMPDDGWFVWGSGSETVGDPVVALINKEEDLSALLYLHRIEDDQARPSQIFNAYLLQLGVDPAHDEVVIDRTQWSAPTFDLPFRASRTVRGIDFVYSGRYVWDGNRSVFFVGWSQGVLENRYRTRLSDLLASFHLLSGTTEPSNIKEKAAAAMILNQIGLLQLQQGDPLYALSFFEKANKLDPLEPLYLINCGYVYQLKRLYGPGIMHFESQMPLVKTHGKLLSILGELHEASYNYDQALNYYTEALRFYPDDEELRINLSDALWGTGYRKQSLEVVESLYKIRPTARLGVYLAKTYMGLDRFSEATDLLLQLNGASSRSQEMGITLATSLLAQGRYREALQVAALTLFQFGSDHRLWMVQGKAQFYLKQFKPALQSFSAAKRLNEGDEETISFLAATQGLLGSGDNKALRKEITPVHPARTPEKMLREGFESPRISDGSPAVVHFREESVHFSSQQPWKITEELLVEILDESGVALFKEFSFSYLPGYDRLYVNFLRIYRPDLSLKWEGKLSDYYVTSEVGEAATTEHQIAHFPLPAPQPGDLIHLQVTRAAIEKSPWPPFIDHRASRYLPVGIDRLTISGNLSMVQIEEYGPVERTEHNGEISWVAREPIVLQQELYTPHYQDIAGGIMISGARDWTSVGVEYEGLIQHNKRGSIAARELAYDIKGSKINPQEIVDSVVAWVRSKITYRNIPFGGHAVVPAGTGETLKRRWGDCKDKSLLAHEILNTLGIPNHLTLVSLREPVSTGLPTIHQFDHMILYIPGGSGYREQFVDLTELGGVRRPVPFGLEGGAALIVDGDSSRLTIMPVVESVTEHRGVMDHRIILQPTGGAEFRDRIELHGKFAAGMREKFGELNDQELKYTVQAWLDDELPGSTLFDIQLQNTDLYDHPFVIILTYGVEKMITPDKGVWRFVPPSLWERIFMKMPRSGRRIHPIRLANTHDFHWKLTVTPPSSWTVEEINRRSPSHHEYTDWKGDVTSDSSNIVFQSEWTTHAVFATPEEYPLLQREWEEILESTMPILRFRSPE